MRLVFLLSLVLAATLTSRAMEHVVFIGTYTNSGASKGIYRVSYDSASLKPTGPVELAAACTNPSFLAYDEGRGLLYTTGDAAASGATKSPAVLRCFRVPADLHSPLNLVTELPLGAVPGASTHVVRSPDGRTLLSVHYNQGLVFSVSLDEAGAPAALVSSLPQEGKLGPNSKRQDKPHPHSFTISPDGRFAFSPDLGLDLVFRYAIAQGSLLVAGEPKAFAVPAGSGPRHAKFSGDGRYFYVVGEMAGTVDVFAYEAHSGELRHLQTISSLAEGFAGENTSAEVQVHPNDSFVYVSNRGPDTLAVFRRDPKTGLLSKIQEISSGGAHPRHFSLSPDGRNLLCANRDSNNVVLFEVDVQSGRLAQTEVKLTVPSPICVVFAR